MGSGQSIPSTLSKEKVFELTRDTRGLMDVLLGYMLKEITVNDFLALSNPTECKKYVIFMANNLYKHFYELQIVPVKDKKGVIAFRPVKELINPPEDAENERQSLCLTLAYFYTRIFQIYGALALTVIDDSRVMMDSGIIPLYGDTTKKGLLPPGFRPYITSGGELSSDDTLIGGALTRDTLGNFIFLRSYLYDEYDRTRGYRTRYYGEGSNGGTIFFLPKIRNRDDDDPDYAANEIDYTSRQKGSFSIGYSGIKRYSTLECSSKIDDNGDTKIFFGKFTYYKKDSDVPEVIELNTEILPKTATIERRDAPRDYRTRDTYSTYSVKRQFGNSLPINEFFNKTLSRVIAFLKRATVSDTSYGTTSSGTMVSEFGTAEELRLARIIQNLTKTKPLGHCLARAIQLLQTAPLRGTDAVSHICKAKFLEQMTTSSTGSKTVISRSGIPKPGTSLDTSPGLAALSQLFYDTVLIGTPRIIIGETQKPGQSKSSLQQYMEFMKTIGRLFGDDTFNKPVSDETIKSGLKSITNRRDGELCRGINENLTIPANVVRNVYDVVNQLYQTQVRHAAECGKIVRLLFDIQRDKSSGRYRISLSDNIIKKGFPEIERVNYMARQLLVNYYSNCEMTYLKGMKIVLDSSPEAIEARRRHAPPAPPAPAPPAPLSNS